MLMPAVEPRAPETERADSSSRPLKKYTVASLFAGMGAFCKAFRDQGFEVLWANEVDRFAAMTYRENFRGTELFEKSIEELSVIADHLRSVDVMTAGFPCQPFSVAGSKAGFADSRGKLFFEIIRLLSEMGPNRPKILLLENVPHLLKHDRGRTFAKIVQEIQQAGYWFLPGLNHQILDTRVHTDIPQQRERLYMAALSWDHFKSNCFEFPAPIATPPRDVRDVLDLDAKAEDWCYFNEDSKYLDMFVKKMAEGRGDGVYVLRRHYVREIKREMVPTLTAHMGEGGHNIPVIRDDWGVRKLTVQECLRLQGLDEDTGFRFPSDVSRSQQYKQIGNAVTVPLVRLLAAECRRQLDFLEKRDR